MKQLSMTLTSKACAAIFLGFINLVACHSTPKKVELGREASLLAPTAVELKDDLDLPSLQKNLKQHIQYLKGQKANSLIFGSRAIRAEVYGRYLKYLFDLSQKKNVMPELLTEISKVSECYPVQGDGKAGQAFMTSYFDPEILASSKPTEKLWRPIYKLPKDMVLVQVAEFQKSFPHWSILPVTEQKSAVPVARGRLVKSDLIPSVLPYWNRYEIDGLGMLRGKGLEIAYADPVDVFVMQIQGSGTLKFTDGKTQRIGYQAQNGFPYAALGKFLKEQIPPDQMNLQSIENYVRSLPPEQAEVLMAQNPSYVFFTPIQGASKTTIGTDVVPGRTIATDRQYFPKGALAFLQFDKPVFSDEKSVQPAGWESVGRLVFDQDTGGAIRGMGRLDLYWGKGAEAKQAAGVMKQWGRICYMGPSAELLTQLEAGSL